MHYHILFSKSLLFFCGCVCVHYGCVHKSTVNVRLGFCQMMGRQVVAILTQKTKKKGRGEGNFFQNIPFHLVCFKLHFNQSKNGFLDRVSRTLFEVIFVKCFSIVNDLTVSIRVWVAYLLCPRLSEYTLF